MIADEDLRRLEDVGVAEIERRQAEAQDVGRAEIADHPASISACITG